MLNSQFCWITTGCYVQLRKTQNYKDYLGGEKFYFLSLYFARQPFFASNFRVAYNGWGAWKNK